MAPKFPNPDPATDSVRDRLNQFVEVAGRAVYPPLAIAPSPTTPGQIWWDISSTIKIRNEANAAWASLSTTMGAVSFREAQTLTSGEKTQSLSNIGAQPTGGYVRYDTSQTLTSGEKTQALGNIGAQPSGSYQPSGGYVRYDTSQSLTDPQKTQARGNIGAGVPVFTGTFNTVDTSASIVHYNTSDRPMFVSAITNTPSAASWMRLYVRALTSDSWYEASAGYDDNHPSVYGIVPSGWQYKLEGVATVITMRTHQ